MEVEAKKNAKKMERARVIAQKLAAKAIELKKKIMEIN